MKTIIAGVSAAALLAVAGAASAQEFSAEIAVTSDYVWRGASQSDGDPAVSGGVEFSYGSFYAGTWASTVDFGDGTDAEWDFYVGFAPTVGVFDLDFAVTQYTYVGDPSGSDYDFLEFKAGASTAVTPELTLGAEVHYSPDFTGGAGDATYLEANFAYDFTPQWAVSGGLGHQWVSGGDYVNWNLGVTWAFSEIVGLDVRYHDTDVHGWGPAFGERVAVTLTAAF